MKDKKFLIIGSAGQLGSEFQRVLSERDACFSAPPENECDITNFGQMSSLIKKTAPDIIINCAAYNLVDEAQENPDIAYLVNSTAVKHLANLCSENDIFLVHYSSDYVFDGEKKEPYTEQDFPSPLNEYGLSKLKGEQQVLEITRDYLIFRVSWVIGHSRQNFLYKLGRWAESSDVLNINNEEISVPTFTVDIVNTTLSAINKGITGLYHSPNSGMCSRYELAKCFAAYKGLKNTIVPAAASTFIMKAKRPLYSVMSNQKISAELGIDIPDWKDSLKKFIHGDRPS